MHLATLRTVGRWFCVVYNVLHRATSLEIFKDGLQVVVGHLAHGDPRHYGTQLSRFNLSSSQRLKKQVFIIVRENSGWIASEVGAVGQFLAALYRIAATEIPRTNFVEESCVTADTSADSHQISPTGHWC